MSLRSDYQSRITHSTRFACSGRASHLSLTHLSPIPQPLTSHQSLLTNHGRASGLALPGSLPCILTRHFAFGISYSSSPSKAFVSSKDWLNSGKAPSPNCTCTSGFQVSLRHRSWPICGSDCLSSCAPLGRGMRRRI